MSNRQIRYLIIKSYKKIIPNICLFNFTRSVDKFSVISEITLHPVCPRQRLLTSNEKTRVPCQQLSTFARGKGWNAKSMYCKMLITHSRPFMFHGDSANYIRRTLKLSYLDQPRVWSYLATSTCRFANGSFRCVPFMNHVFTLRTTSWWSWEFIIRRMKVV